MYNHCHCMKSVRIQRVSGPYFPALGLNTERDGESIFLYSVQMPENAGQKTSNTDTFLVVCHITFNQDMTKVCPGRRANFKSLLISK